MAHQRHPSWCKWDYGWARSRTMSSTRTFADGEGLEGWQTDGSHKFYTALKPIRLKEWPVSWVGRVSAAGAFPSNFPRSSRCIDLCQSRFANNSEGLLMPLLHFSMPLRWCWCPWCCHNGSNLRVKLDMLQRLTKLVTCSFFIPGILKVGGVY